jgi:hypothetical protein
MFTYLYRRFQCLSVPVYRICSVLFVMALSGRGINPLGVSRLDLHLTVLLSGSQKEAVSILAYAMHSAELGA